MLAAAAFFVIGGVWYGALFSKPWMRLSGVPQEQAEQSNYAVVFGSTGLLGVVAAIGLAAAGDDAGAATGMLTGLGVGLLIVGPLLAIQNIYYRKPATILAINGGYHVVGLVVMGAIVGAYQ